MSNKVEISPGRWWEIAGYIGTSEKNVFQKIGTDQVKLEKIGEVWHIYINPPKSLLAGLSFKMSKKNNSLIIDDLILKTETREILGDITVTLMAGEPNQPLSIILYDGPVKSFRKNIIEMPGIMNIKLEDFTASIAASFKKAQENISQKLGEESFELEIEDFEIKTPYIVQMSDDRNLMMKLPQPSETLNSDEAMFSKLKFKKTIKLK